MNEFLYSGDAFVIHALINSLLCFLHQRPLVLQFRMSLSMHDAPGKRADVLLDDARNEYQTFGSHAGARAWRGGACG